MSGAVDDGISPFLKKESRSIVQGSIIQPNSLSEPRSANAPILKSAFGSKNKVAKTYKNDELPEMKAKEEEKLINLQKLKLASLAKQEEIINNSSIPKKRELTNKFNMTKNKYMTKPSDLKALGTLGYKLEELRLSIEKRYEHMMNEINQKLEIVKTYFNSLINEVKSENFNQIIDEKETNLANIKDSLEDKLIKSLANKEKTGYDLDHNNTKNSFIAFFDFFENFKEECFNSIVSKCAVLNIENLKKQLKNFKSSNLENILAAPKVFASNIFRLFESADQNPSSTSSNETKTFGDVFQENRETVDFCQINRANYRYDPDLNSFSKAPLVSVINKDYLLIATRNKFKIVKYLYSNNEFNVPKSKFYQNVFKEKGDRLNFTDVFNSTDLKDVKRDEPLSYHSVCTAKISEEMYYILLGGSNSVRLANFRRSTSTV